MSCSYISCIHLCFGFCSLRPAPKPPSHLSPPRKARPLLSARQPPARLGSAGGRASCAASEPCPGSGIRTPQRENRDVALGLLKPSERAQSGWDATKTFPLHRPYPLSRRVRLFGRRRQLLSPSLSPAKLVLKLIEGPRSEQ